jgi:hypothetical protein
VGGPVIAGVGISAYPETVFFAKGQEFTYAGLELRFVYDDGTYGRKLSATEYTVEEINTLRLAPPSLARTKSVTITILPTPEGDFPPITYGVQIDSSTSILTGITMTTPPTKKVYLLEETFNAAGLEITGTYSGGDRNGETVRLKPGVITVSGYSPFRRKTQTVTLKMNGTVLGTVDVTVQAPAGAVLKLNNIQASGASPQSKFLAPVRIKGMPFNAAASNLQAFLTKGGKTYTLSSALGDITDADVSGYDATKTGNQTLTLNLEGNTRNFDIYVADVEPAVWFDYGYRRTLDDPQGAGPGAGVYYAKPNEKLVIAPVRYLLGYNADHTNAAGTVYSWTVSGGASDRSYTTSANGELLHITPKTAGEYTITVKVSGKSYITGETVEKTATAKVVCYTGTVARPADKTYHSPLKNFAPGQHNEGTGNGWSCGAALGYEVWSLPNGANPLEIYGNPFSGWSEAGIVWVQYDENGNGIPDEMWYEIKGGEDDTANKAIITRRYAVTYFRGPDPYACVKGADGNFYYERSLDLEGIWSSLLASGQPGTRNVFWVDAKGRTGGRVGGWPYGASLSDEVNTYATFTGTLLRDNGNIYEGNYRDLPEVGYVDAAAGSKEFKYGHFDVARHAMRADGTNPDLDPARVRFVKVQTAIFHYGGSYGNVSTEIVYGTGLPDQSNGFPMPWD